MECESNPWCLFCRLGAPEQSPDVLGQSPGTEVSSVGTGLTLALVVPTNPFTSLGKELSGSVS